MASPRIIKKYPNRRLYDTETSAYITLAEVKDADLLVHVVDASSPQASEQRAVAEEVIAGFGVEKRRILLAYNKTDRPHAGALDADSIRISAATGAGLLELREAIVARLTALGSRMPFYGSGQEPEPYPPS